jgi:hypothetical protein
MIKGGDPVDITKAGFQKPPETVSEVKKIKKFPGGAPPDPPS